jgi:hypothetical protein
MPDWGPVMAHTPWWVPWWDLIQRVGRVEVQVSPNFYAWISDHDPERRWTDALRQNT